LSVYKGLYYGESKQSYGKYAEETGQKLGHALVSFGNHDRMMLLWLLSMFARYVSVAFLVCAFAKHPYSYYTMLRWVVCCTCIYTALLCFKGHKPWMPIFGAIAFLFNPIDPITMARSIWIVIDWADALFLVFSIFSAPEQFGRELIQIKAFQAQPE
jgi:hypothetical protein